MSADDHAASDSSRTGWPASPLNLPRLPGSSPGEVSGPSRHYRLPSDAVISVWGHKRPTGVAVLQHGYGEHAGRYVTQQHQLVGHLTSAGHEVWALDLLGHGRSPGRRAVTDVRQGVRDHLETRRMAAGRGLPVVAVGHSLGGLVTAASVAAENAGLDRVVLLSPALPKVPARPVRRLLLGLARLAPGLGLSFLSSDPSRLARSPGHEQVTRNDPHMYVGPLRMQAAATALEVMASLNQQAPAWSVPTLVLHGTDDDYTNYEGSVRLAARLPPQTTTLHLLPDGRHELLDDLGGDLALRYVMEFLQHELP